MATRQTDSERRSIGATVGEAMHAGIISVAPDDGIDALARAMADNRVHCLLVEGFGEAGAGRSVWGIVSDLDLMRALQAQEDVTAARLAGTEVLTIDAARPLGDAVELMVAHEVTHLVVVTEGEPVGVMSTLDVAAIHR